MGHRTERGYESHDNTIKIDLCQAGARQGEIRGRLEEEERDLRGKYRTI
jgi:hypothetical protein